MTGRVLVLGSRVDPDVAAVLGELGDDVLLCDPDLLAADRHFGWSLDAGRDPLVRIGDEEFALDDVGAVLVRPHIRLDRQDGFAEYVLAPHPDLDADEEPHARSEASAAVLGALLPAGARWVNHPRADHQAEYKLAQLRVARDAGLPVPRTLVSTDARQLRAFWESAGGRVVMKDVTSRSGLVGRRLHTTREVTAEHIAQLDDTVPSVVLLQERIEARADVRVTLVGEDAFACAIHSAEGDSPYNWQLDQAVPITPCSLDDALLAALHRVRRNLGLTYGAVDLRVTPDGAPVFLEINPRGSFAWVEARTGLPIARALAALLAGPGPA